MRVCVLQADYSTSQVDYQHYDPPRDLTALLPPGSVVDHVFLNKLHTYSQLKALGRKGYDIFVNLCEGYLEWSVPSIDVIHVLDLLNLPYTGPSARLYDPPKELMKYVAYTEGVATPAYVLIRDPADAEKAVSEVGFPLFVKPAKAGDSLGVDEYSLVQTREELYSKVNELLLEYETLLAEAYIAGREFTVLVGADAKVAASGMAGLSGGTGCKAFRPVEFIFPEGRHFKTYALKTSELHPEANVPCGDPLLETRLKEASERIFKAFGGVGYGRLDFRLSEGGELYFLEINFTCSVFYDKGYEGSADYILRYDGIGASGFLKQIIAEGIDRHRRKQKMYVVKGSPISGYGIYAARDITPGELIFGGEERPQRIVTRAYVDKFWTDDQRAVFSRYAYPLSRQVFVLWDEDPAEWAPQNHSCAPNTAFVGLNVYATGKIREGEELTLDYAMLMDETLEPFSCHCGAPGCRGRIGGEAGNSIKSASSWPK
jgi:hypothetical protein